VWGGTDVVAVAGPADGDELADFDVRGDGIEGDGCGGKGAEEGEQGGWEGEFHCSWSTVFGRRMVLVGKCVWSENIGNCRMKLMDVACIVLLR
jgi:hypothetical protein